MPFNVSVRALVHWMWLRLCPPFVSKFPPSPVWTFASASKVASNHCDQPSGRRFTALEGKRWSMRFVTPELSGSIANLNTPIVSCTCGLA